MTSNDDFVAPTCIVGVIVTNESNMASYLPEAGNSNGSNADMCPDEAGPSSSGSGDLFDFGSSFRSLTFTFPPTSNTTGRHLGFERDYNSQTTFRDVLRFMHKVYSASLRIILISDYYYHCQVYPFFHSHPR